MGWIVIHQPKGALQMETEYHGPFATYDLAEDALCKLPPAAECECKYISGMIDPKFAHVEEYRAKRKIMNGEAFISALGAITLMRRAAAQALAVLADRRNGTHNHDDLDLIDAREKAVEALKAAGFELPPAPAADEDEDERDPGQRGPCPGHVWRHTGEAYGGDERGEGRVYCELCGADGDA